MGSVGNFVVPSMNDRLYIEEGDLLIGGIFSITDEIDKLACGQNVSEFFRIDLVESVVFSIRDINKVRCEVKQLFPDLKLGFVITDACNQRIIAALQALRFSRNSEVQNSRNGSSNLKNGNFQSFDVVGVIGTDASLTTIPAARVLGASQIPMISFRATYDVLSDQKLFPNFFRVVSPDEVMLSSMAHFIVEQHWYYFSVVYDNEYQYQSLISKLSGTTYCESIQIKVQETSNFTDVLTQLTSGNYSSKIIVVLTSDFISKIISQKVYELKLNRKLLWLGSDSWAQLIFDGRAPDGTIGVSYTSSLQPSEDYMLHLSGLYNKSNNPWMVSAMQNLKITNETSYKKMIRHSYYLNPSLSSMAHKSVYMLLYLLKQFLGSKNCYSGHGAEIARCFSKYSFEFQAYLRKHSTRDGQKRDTPWRVEDATGRFSFYQLVSKDGRHLLCISHHIIGEDKLVERENPVSVNSFDFHPDYLDPTRFCMPQCGNNEIRQHVTHCCWRCRACSEDKIVSESGDACDECPLLHWPSYLNSTATCQGIEPDFITLSQPVSFLLLIVVIISSLYVVAVFVWYVVNQGHSLVKASSPDLNYVQLITFLMGYISVVFFIVEPTHKNCTIGFLLFSSSFNISYLIMLTKAIRVYRIFITSVTTIKIPYISNEFHISVCVGFFLGEILRFSVINYLFPITASLFQPVPSLKYAEKACAIPDAHVVVFIILDCTLLLTCTFLAFKTQTLPNRFRESRYVSVCVVTALVVWSAFLPAYFTSVYRRDQSTLVVFAVLINNNMTLSMLFVTRLVTVEYLRGHGWLFNIASLFWFCERSVEK
ncbi:metabotropic glutamate receptor 6 [Biomphalaria pfeifferi]|uniref:Metabotropic glutamate receptor 6 n=1 Tax=Biomphalaria pfeifferi TaxID=112525 RepID=A0AAD8B099_BIOPF|nr:metabotropic glutamate receptor 6 [Biomphalaria pfeifferi]